MLTKFESNLQCWLARPFNSCALDFSIFQNRFKKTHKKTNEFWAVVVGACVLHCFDMAQNKWHAKAMWHKRVAPSNLLSTAQATFLTELKVIFSCFSVTRFYIMLSYKSIDFSMIFEAKLTTATNQHFLVHLTRKLKKTGTRFYQKTGTRFCRETGTRGWACCF